MVMDAVLLNIELIGEYVNKIDDYFKEDNKEIPWNAIKGMRNRIAHDYDGLAMDILWEIIKNDIPDLKKKLENI